MIPTKALEARHQFLDATTAAEGGDSSHCWENNDASLVPCLATDGTLLPPQMLFSLETNTEDTFTNIQFKRFTPNLFGLGHP